MTPRPCPFVLMTKAARDMRTNMEIVGGMITKKGKPNYSRDKLTSVQFLSTTKLTHTDWSEIREVNGRRIDDV